MSVADVGEVVGRVVVVDAGTAGSVDGAAVVGSVVTVAAGAIDEPSPPDAQPPADTDTIASSATPTRERDIAHPSHLPVSATPRHPHSAGRIPARPCSTGDLPDPATKAAAAHGIMTLRRELQRSRVVGYFSSPDDLATRVATAVTNLGIGQRLFKNVIRLTEPVLVSDSSFFGGIRNEIQRASLSGRRVSTVNISEPGGWWSTRLYLLAVLAEALTTIQRIAVVDQAANRPAPDANGANGFVGMLSTSTVARTMGRLFPVLTPFETEVRTCATEGLVQEVVLTRAEEAWTRLLPHDIEEQQKRDVTRPNLVTWFGDAMFTGTVDVDDVEAPRRCSTSFGSSAIPTTSCRSAPVEPLANPLQPPPMTPATRATDRTTRPHGAPLRSRSSTSTPSTNGSHSSTSTT